MLKLKYLFENYELARHCLAFYNHDKTDLEDMLRHFRISSNAIYPFCANGKICFLRLSPAEEKSVETVESEIRLIRWLREQQFPAPRVIPMKNGKLVEQVQTPWGMFNVSCFERVPGENLEDTDNSFAVVRGYGETLGRLHALMKAYPLTHTRRSHDELLDEIGARLWEYHAPEAVKTEFGSVKRYLDELKISRDTYGMVHYDFEADNVFYDPDTGCFSVIDFDDALRCWFALDVARALDALKEMVKASELKWAEDEFLLGYQVYANFTREQQSTLPLMRRLIRLQEYAGLLHVMSEPVEDVPEWMDMLVEKLTGKLRILEALMQ